MERVHLLRTPEKRQNHDDCIIIVFHCLQSGPAEERQLPRIPQNQLHSASRPALADRVTQSCAGDWLPPTLAVLELLPNLVAAQELQRALRAVAKGGKHFVDQHREAIISGVSLVPPILDRLYSLDLLTMEKYNVVMAEKTAQAQMRQLYSYVNSWYPDDKDKFYLTMLHHEGPLIKTLGGSCKRGPVQRQAE